MDIDVSSLIGKLQAIVEFFIWLGTHATDAVILVACSLLAMPPTIALEWWGLPTVTEPDAKRRQKLLTYAFNWTIASASSATLWWIFDPVDPLRVRVAVSIVCGGLGFWIYPPAARWLTDRIPAIGSAWDGMRGDK